MSVETTILEGYFKCFYNIIQENGYSLYPCTIRIALNFRKSVAHYSLGLRPAVCRGKNSDNEN